MIKTTDILNDQAQLYTILKIITSYFSNVLSGSLSVPRVPVCGSMVVKMHLVQSLTFLNITSPILIQSQSSSQYGAKSGPSTTTLGLKLSTETVELPILLTKSFTED